MKCSKCGEKNLTTNAIFCHRCGNKVENINEFIENSFFFGRILQNRYRLETVLGSGGWGAVYKASYISPELGKIFGNYCAVKEMKNNNTCIKTDRLMEMFEQEAITLVQLKHEHIPRITDYFQENGKYYLVMEYIEGKNLEKIIEENGMKPLPEGKVIQWAIEICEVIDYLHTRKPRPYIFRDLKPANIILDKNGKITLVDFGITKIFIPENKNTLKIGTPGYSSPEQYEGKEDPRTDIYALGITLHYLLTGRDPSKEKPFSCQDIPVKSLNPLISEDISFIINKAVQNDLNRRFQTSKELLDAITSVFWKSLSPKKDEKFEWIKTETLFTCNIKRNVTRKLVNNDIPPEEKIERKLIKKEIIFVPPELNKEITEEPGWYDIRIKAERLSLTSGFNNLLSLQTVPLVPYNHQKKTALDALRIMRGRVLLADEVGLGKTIEAGIIMKELKLRGLIKKILILVPASLTTQWAQELKLHFNEDFTLQKEEKDWNEYNQLIASIDTARRENHCEIISKLQYDLIIVDEAHKLKNRNSKTWKMVNGITKRYILMLTATPVQNDLEELFNLITLLKPGQLRTLKEFRKKFIDSSDKRLPANPEELKKLLQEVMIRNRRSSVDVYLPPRRAGIYYLQETIEEKLFRIKLTEFLRNYYRDNRGIQGISLQLIQIQKALGSSVPAVMDMIKNWMEKLEKDSIEYNTLSGLYGMGKDINENRKATALMEILKKTSDKVIIFTEFLSTQYYLKGLTEENGYSTAIFNGRMDIKEKDRQLNFFREEGRILISTQSGSEGKNLQFCHIMINYDLPWNPMRLEQRIGRLHRLTQEREVIVFNLCLMETFEGYILYLLSEKIKMFELVIGELDLILGDLEKDENFEHMLQKIWLEAESEEDIKTGVENLGNKLGEARKKFQETMSADMAISTLFDGE